MKLSRLRRPVCFGGLAALFACSTPISPYPQIEDDEEEPLDGGNPLDASRPSDAGSRPFDANVGDARPSVDAGTFDCDVYSASASCPRTPPAENSACTLRSDERCFYASKVAGQVQLAQCQPVGNSGRSTWRLGTARCSYQCSTDLPQTSNFFSLNPDGCTGHKARACQDGKARTSQEGADRFLRELAAGCGFNATFQLGVAFSERGCPEWLHYQRGPALTSAQKDCLTDRLESTRLDCDPSCALTPSMAP